MRSTPCVWTSVRYRLRVAECHGASPATDCPKYIRRRGVTSGRIPLTQQGMLRRRTVLRQAERAWQERSLPPQARFGIASGHRLQDADSWTRVKQRDSSASDTQLASCQKILESGSVGNSAGSDRDRSRAAVRDSLRPQSVRLGVALVGKPVSSVVEHLEASRVQCRAAPAQADERLIERSNLLVPARLSMACTSGPAYPSFHPISSP